MNDNIKNGIGGAIIGATIMFGGLEVSTKDVDVVTGYTYEKIVTEPETDVYYIIPVTENADYFENSHQKTDTVRKSLDGSMMVIKYDVNVVPRNKNLGTPYTNEEILQELDSPEWKIDDTI